MTAIYRRLPRLLHELLFARADGTYAKLLARLAKTDVLVIDDWDIAPLADQERRDLLEVQAPAGSLNKGAESLRFRRPFCIVRGMLARR